jgi:hypothetical protein
MIALLGGSLVDDDQIQRALRNSVETLQSRQSPLGCIPNNVDAATKRTNFRAYADGGLWWVIGTLLMGHDLEGIHSALRWYEMQDVDQSGLLSMQEGADWQDLFCTRGKGLYLNCAYVLALRAAGYSKRADAVTERINKYFWYLGDGEMLRYITHSFSTENVQRYDSLGRERWIPEKKYLADEQYYLPYLGFRVVGEWFDTLGNLLAILAGVADEKKTDMILDLINRHGIAYRPIRAIYPVIQPGDSDWRDYYGTLNIPHQYHNGGVWPFIGGFYIAALVKAERFDEAEQALRRLAELCKDGEFNEWHHGQTGEAMGVRDQAWSAGMYIFAYECVKSGRVALSFLREQNSVLVA